ncbi:hypothetical protein A2715_05000 [Candidatus Woesebacteria bacterium RIFCSPHIGHO2_01_FULL_39_32]|uniref:Glycosyl transferase family 1 domain-containing protein n=1 Tax=Candidatus Woesebacteria bacterium RIFCSPLOWO2_01_FULL_39_25 TaxID=1802521 RepID=A0A1F8BNP4_9BACT|nr:MAG: hypothetical protein A2124_00715 [Candidatus Woesebacteria bacterium GWB1_37_5]OGM25377.1 MAG: hypothetical protein A2715_05000 [Candidatus Woesebacteria bacterium RIFCSPHIGHO2_01_FULL_39_32]OGM38485.1 MAG: hypothetical protein A3F01_03955 [Candidatus Woesebacteria bacterium RIFCSPHIGHO2_12_FULL_38_11]OGM64908.1 MAG: hypothetical protein A2893_04610 [Candidatus Woesebacteria bacterium RIFCSPLOWO2_01_FULL_39_25]
MFDIKQIRIFALAAYGKGLSGGDRIFIEFARRWSKNFPVEIYVWKEGAKMLERQHLGIFNSQFSLFNANKDYRNLKVHVSKLKNLCKLGFLFCYLTRIIEGIRLGLSLKLITNHQSPITIYSASEFWMDSLPAFILKLRYPKITWAASWYQTAPNPFHGYLENGQRRNKYFFSSLFYWLMQLPIKPLISSFADYVLVNNEEERKQFSDLNKKGRMIVVLGAVPLEEINKFLITNSKLLTTKEYDAVFQGRLHAQKGVVELIDIWKKVVEIKPLAKLAMIGDGPLMGKVKKRITMNKLTNNIKVFGYVFDGPKKYKIFSKSKIVVHPAFYDSGGMASAEAMAFGLPCVGFNLKAYKSYYPQGMVKVDIGNTNAFAKKIMELLENYSLRIKIGREAKYMIEENWSWEKRANEVLERITTNK